MLYTKAFSVRVSERAHQRLRETVKKYRLRNNDVVSIVLEDVDFSQFEDRFREVAKDLPNVSRSVRAVVNKVTRGKLSPDELRELKRVIEQKGEEIETSEETSTSETSVRGVRSKIKEMIKSSDDTKTAAA